ncbi:SAM-dependent methyltransferase [Mariniblastus fucicola]|uniref:Cyclopropane-fatty-acyl-phospholipid synthase n=1 Tax=Mariniblastus fucicola TaxID=980251 RepID=A0A5B9PG88_9BACT|nr:cyclopropane-fatty-acyl-phospholipid synthase family protein [Mariniblastus fucicola]QEG21901.1 Cyclopropane-fatty-acyl-phospholipid synthase [Mariniblastus fucicola]
MSHVSPQLSQSISRSRSADSIQPHFPAGDWEVGPLNAGSDDAQASRFQERLLERFSRLKHGSINLFQGGQRFQLGDAPSELSANILVSDSAFYRRILMGGTIGSAETYMDGLWSCSDLTSLIRIMIRNIDQVSSLNKAVSRIRTMIWRLKHAARKNSVQGSKRNIVEHYDLGNDFYKLFLDPTMNYSSGIFDQKAAAGKFSTAEDALHAASLTKMDRICQKLNLQPGDEVLEIGTGWGAMAVHMASHYGCHVTTTTISEEQYRLACERVEVAEMQHRVTVLKQDYRTLTGQYDKIVSIEMVEAVGHEFMNGFFAKCSSLLRDDGAMCLQAITMSPQNWKEYLRSVDFIRAYVFPGGCLPTVGSLHAAAADATNMRMLHTEDMTPHYATTLNHWKRRFLSRLEAVRSLGYDENLIRMWNFYLSYCEAGFEERRVHCVQTMFGKPGSKIDVSTSMSGA